MQVQMLNNAKAKGFWFKAFRGKRFRILKKEKKKLEKFIGLFFQFLLLLWQNSDMTAAAKALAAVKTLSTNKDRTLYVDGPKG